MESLVLLLEKDTEASVFVVRELVFLDAYETFSLSERDLATVKRSDIYRGKLDGEVLVGGFRCQGLLLLV